MLCFHLIHMIDKFIFILVVDFMESFLEESPSQRSVPSDVVDDEDDKNADENDSHDDRDDERGP